MSPDVTPGSKRAITFRPMTIRDVPFGFKLSLAAGWNQTEADWVMLLEQEADGSFVACLDGEEAGTVTSVNYQNRLHWIGMVLVAEEFRRLGIGRALLETAIGAVKNRGVVGLDATPAGKRLYDTLGFQVVYEMSRCLRQPAQGLRFPIFACPPLAPAMLLSVAAYDLPVFGADRTSILASLQRRAPQLAFYTERNGRLAGYCLGRYGSRYVQIGPVVAEDLEAARELLLTALQSCGEREVIVDIPFHQPRWNQLLGELGFVEQRPFVRMSLGTLPISEKHLKQLAIAGPEIG